MRKTKEIKDTRKIKDFPVSTGNLRFPLDFRGTQKLKIFGVLKTKGFHEFKNFVFKQTIWFRNSITIIHKKEYPQIHLWVRYWVSFLVAILPL